MESKCSNCNNIFQVTGTNILMVLSGGLDCPECKTENGINLITARKKDKKK